MDKGTMSMGVDRKAPIVTTTKDIMERYGVCVDQARKIMREITQMYGGKTPLGRGKCFTAQLEEWERLKLVRGSAK